MLIKLNAAQVAVYRDLLSRQARRGKITPITRLQASLAARNVTPTFVPPPPRTAAQRAEDKWRSNLRRVARSA
jgi:hypothetical protein